VQAGAGVTVCMTAEAQKFVTPLTFEALSGRPVRTAPSISSKAPTPSTSP
jgi:phosphopantothenoylcysteine decarboxylase/phosphopantothenate--cysteine ligase